jgi:hypothetical protein
MAGSPSQGEAEMAKKLWEVWSYIGKPQMVAVVRGHKEAVDKAKQLAPRPALWHQTHKVFRADK